MNLIKVLLSVVGLLLMTPVKADILVLIHGYLGSANSWENSGVNQALENVAWQRSGVYVAAPQGVVLYASPKLLSENKAYSVELISTAPIDYQAQQLQAILDVIMAKHKAESITLIGHSAGGVIARTALVKWPNPSVKHLISIASPHSGTMRAVQGLNETGSGGPIGMVKNMFGGELYQTVKQSRPLLFDLLTPRPGNFLHWLNLEDHPNIRYTSLVTLHAQGEGDEMVTGFSQDMNNVPVLAGRSGVLKFLSQHELDETDGMALVDVLNIRSIRR